MLHADFSGNANLFRAGAQQFSKACRRHRTGDPDFTLTADFRAGNRRVHLIQRANSACRQEVAGVNIRADRLNKMVVVSQYRRNDAARAVGWRRHDATACGVLFVHRQSKHVHPVNDVHRIAGKLIAGNQHTTQRGGATRYAQRPRQHAFGIHTAINTGLHGLPDVTEILFNLFLAMQRQFVLHHHAGE